jgi:hypothetical protein
MSILLFTIFMIDNIKQLEEFIKSTGVKSQDLLILALIERKPLISEAMAKLVSDKLTQQA